MTLEPFVRTILAGGCALVVGLWVTVLVRPWSVLWTVGVLASALGLLGLGAGIVSALER